MTGTTAPTSASRQNPSHDHGVAPRKDGCRSSPAPDKATDARDLDQGQGQRGSRARCYFVVLNRDTKSDRNAQNQKRRWLLISLQVPAFSSTSTKLLKRHKQPDFYKMNRFLD